MVPQHRHCEHEIIYLPNEKGHEMQINHFSISLTPIDHTYQVFPFLLPVPVVEEGLRNVLGAGDTGNVGSHNDLWVDPKIYCYLY